MLRPTTKTKQGRERESKGAQIVAGHSKHGARRCSDENTGGRNSKMRPYLDSKCLAKGWRLKCGTRHSYWCDRLENGAAMAASEHGGATVMVWRRGAPFCSGVGERERGARVKWSEQQRRAPYPSTLA